MILIKISTKGRYALRLILDLAIHDTGEYIPVKNISTRQGISIKYLEQIITALTCAGFVRSTRGAQGDYKLARKPADYTVGMILRLICKIIIIDKGYIRRLKKLPVLY